MPISRITPTKRGKMAALGAASALVLAVGALIKPWEGRELAAYRDIVGVWTICYGETKDVRPGQTATPAECDRKLLERVEHDYRRPLTACIATFDDAPISWQAAAISLAYNVGVPKVCNSTAAKRARERQWLASCMAMTAFNKAGDKVRTGLVNRRENGDAQRIGEAELCVSGL